MKRFSNEESQPTKRTQCGSQRHSSVRRAVPSTDPALSSPSRMMVASFCANPSDCKIVVKNERRPAQREDIRTGGLQDCARRLTIGGML
jgi:hypothetical protein